MFTLILQMKAELFTIIFSAGAKLFTVGCGEWFRGLSLPPMNNFGGTIRARVLPGTTSARVRRGLGITISITIRKETICRLRVRE